MQFSFPLRNFISSQCCCFSMIFDLAVSTLIKNKSRKRVVTYVVVFVGAIFVDITMRQVTKEFQIFEVYIFSNLALSYYPVIPSKTKNAP